MKKIFLLLFLTSIFLSCSQDRKHVIVERPIGWQLKETPTDASLRGLSVLTNNIIWASGSKGTWLRSLDGGETWDFGIVAGLDSVDFRDIIAFDASTAVVMSSGQPAVIYKTVDGGKTWDLKYKGPENAFLDGITFVGDKGYAIGDEVDGKWMVLLSKDQGEHWKWLETSPAAPAGAGSFAASGSSILADQDNIWFVGAGLHSAIYHSSDGGTQWTKTALPFPDLKESAGVFSIFKVSDKKIVGVGGDFLQADANEHAFVFSDDGGSNWSVQDSQTLSGYRSGVVYYPFQHWLIAVGPNGTDFSKDVGQNWEKLSDEGFHAVKLCKSFKNVWASGSGGKIARLEF
ncbi:WD40/YVTN/BNR-like repeat-containing protein [Mongoliitalea daihaiensis]|uniref:WD40/YVTN/BNR-like repeat-containing protein n=1 Tax=Mongoliitalea daihaiensis TaxID=2782006 RepID=UPI001F1D4C4C|nr:YCF48-related protein [Mongoliitalea daihaiensis]UJP65803.1 photosystem II stability/assembly factor-like protein [Mongoliitalea daihaiensis]